MLWPLPKNMGNGDPASDHKSNGGCGVEVACQDPPSFVALIKVLQDSFSVCDV